jgi:ribosomal protein S18 acetylase RimI-like enzyme
MVMAMERKATQIRGLRRDDLGSVTEIDEIIRGAARPNYWKARFEAIESAAPWASLVAEMDNRIVGFVFGWSSSSQFGVPGEIGWIDIIGVHPVYRRHGIGRALVDEFTRLAKEMRKVEKVFTLVDPEEIQTANFFGHIGFARGKLIHMESV